MNVLSLFDGISCGQLALQRAGIKYDKYFASEIDDKALDVTMDNFPKTIQLGDVTNLIYEDGDFINREYIEVGDYKGNYELKLPAGKIDLLMGGSPCQGFSSIGKGKNFEDPRSKLFWHFVRLKNETKPKYFLLENVKMKKEYRDIISEHLGVQPITINSSIFSAQNRIRLYWTNIPIDELPQDKGLTIEDTIFNSEAIQLGFHYQKPKNFQLRVPPNLPQFVDPYNKKEVQGKSTTLRTNICNGNMWVKIPGGYRNLTRNECEMLQTVPLNYTKAISENQAKKLLGNAWTVDVLSFIFKNLKKE
jgi:DNA-cytosine methyltransferase